MDATANDAVSLDSICTCKTCGHSRARDCINAACSCCGESNHSMVMDGMEGFLPKDHQQQQKDEAKQDAR